MKIPANRQYHSPVRRQVAGEKMRRSASLTATLGDRVAAVDGQARRRSRSRTPRRRGTTPWRRRPGFSPAPGRCAAADLAGLGLEGAAGEVGLDPARQDRVDLDRVLGQLDGRRPGEAKDTGLGGRVVGEAARTEERVERAEYRAECAAFRAETSPFALWYPIWVVVRRQGGLGFVAILTNKVFE